MSYASYLRTKHWKDTRKAKLNDKPLCQICKANKSVHVHHKYYTKKDESSILFNEQLTDLITLCSSCHRLTHAYFGINAKKINKKILQVQNLLAKGAIKNKAFWAVSKDLYIPLMHGK